MRTSLVSLCLLSICLVVPGAFAASIGGVLFEDPDRNGTLDPGEAVLPGVRVLLVGGGGAVLQQTLSGSDGSFLFSGLVDGDYVLSVPAGQGLRGSLPLLVADPPPLDLPFGRPRYSAPPTLAGKVVAAGRGASLRHMALGDSIGFGFNFCGSLTGEEGYIEPTTQRLRQAAGSGVITDKQAIPGDETDDLLDPDFDLLLGFNDVFHAVDQQAGLVSISIGGNDFLGAVGSGDPALADALVTARQNIQEILSSLLSEIPGGEVEINTVYDNEEGQDPVQNLWAPIWMQVLREVAWGQQRRVTIAEIYPEYKHDEDGVRLGQGGLICNDFLGLDGIHPTIPGYDVHEEKLWQAFGGVTLTGGDRLDVDLGFLPERGRLPAAEFEETLGDTQSPEAALALDGVGALIPAGNAEFRLRNFRPTPVPGVDLDHAILNVRYRTTGAPLDDTYRFEASIDGTFSPPGDTPTTWNTIVPLVGSAGNGNAELLAFPDQPVYRVVSAPLYLGAPISGEGTLVWDDLATLAVRVVTTAVGEADAYAIEWDGAWLTGFATPPGGVAGPEGAEVGLSAGRSSAGTLALGSLSVGSVSAASRSSAGLSTVGRSTEGGSKASAAEIARDDLWRLAVRDRQRARQMVVDGLVVDPANADLAALLPDLCTPADSGLIGRLAGSELPEIRVHALRALSCLPAGERRNRWRQAALDSDAAVRRVAARGLSAAPTAADSGIFAAWLDDSDSIVRQLAVRGLSQMDGSEVMLARALARDGNAAVQITAAAALLRRGDDRGVPRLLEALAAVPPSDEARRVLRERAADHPHILAAFDDPRPELQALAADLAGYAEWLKANDLDRLRNLLTVDSPAVRVAGVGALSRLGDVASLEPIAALADDPRLTIAVVDALDRLALPAGRPHLARIAASPTAAPTARRRAAKSLALAADANSAHLLRELAGSADVRIARLAKAGLARLDLLPHRSP